VSASHLGDEEALPRLHASLACYTMDLIYDHQSLLLAMNEGAGAMKERIGNRQSREGTL